MAAPKVTFKWDRDVNKIVDEASGGEKTRLFMATTWHRLYDPFTPMDTGLLAHGSARYSVENGVGVITHDTPYAHRLYEGKRLNFRKDRHNLASAHWDQAAKMAGKGAQLAKETQAFLNGRWGK